VGRDVWTKFVQTLNVNTNENPLKVNQRASLREIQLQQVQVFTKLRFVSSVCFDDGF